MKRPWKIEYKNADGYVVTLPRSFGSMVAANKAVVNIWSTRDDVSEGLTLVKVVRADEPDRGYEVWESEDGFHQYTVYHTDSVVYS